MAQARIESRSSNLSVTLRFRGKAYQVKPGMTLRSSLEKNSINPEAVLAVRDGVMITDDELLNDGDIIQLVAVISGG